MSIIYEDPPCNIEEILEFSFSFVNLQKFLNTIMNNNKELYIKITDIYSRFDEMEKIKSDLKDLTYRVSACEEKFTETENTMEIQKQKILDVELKNQLNSNKISSLDNGQKMIEASLRAHDEQLLTMKKYCDENMKSILKISEINEKIRTSNEFLTDKLDKSDKNILKINNELLKFNEFEQNIKNNYSMIEDTTKNFGDFQYFSNKKFSDIDANILNLLQNFTDLNKKSDKVIPSAHIATLNVPQENTTSQNSNNINMDYIGKINKELDNSKKLIREFSEKLERISRNNIQNENCINDILIRVDELVLKDNNVLREIEKEDKKIEEFSAKLTELENKVIQREMIGKDQENNFNNYTEQIIKLHDGMRILTNTTSNKANKDDLEKITKLINIELEKLNTKISDHNKNFETKMKGVAQINQMIANNNINLNQTKGKKGDNELFENGTIEPNFKIALKQVIIEELSNKLQEIMTFENEFFNEFITKISENKNEIGVINSEIKDIKNKLSESYIINLFKDNMIEAYEKLQEIETNLKKSIKEAEKRFKEIEGYGIEIEEELYDFDKNLANREEVDDKGSISMKEILRISLEEQRKIIEKIEKVSHRQDNLNNDILNKVKKDLSNESSKILDEFRHDLKHSIGKVEDQLREKVDRFSLDEFGRKVDNKLNNEINKKIDRTDLKKNNTIINKKIDTLENKISKTLVDTLIDLQMDEVPLIIKKSMNGEKCASCNQFMQSAQGSNSYQPLNTAPFNSHQDDDNRHYATQTKFKLRNIQDNSNKFGTGSYSRFLNNVDNVNEELLNKNRNCNYLPDISSMKNLTKKNFTFYNSNNITNTLNSANSTVLNTNTGINNTNHNQGKIRIDELAEKQFNILINEELEKKIVNPENLIKTANKVYDNIEKRNIAANLK